MLIIDMENLNMWESAILDFFKHKDTPLSLTDIGKRFSYNDCVFSAIENLETNSLIVQSEIHSVGIPLVKHQYGICYSEFPQNGPNGYMNMSTGKASFNSVDIETYELVK